MTSAWQKIETAPRDGTRFLGYLEALSFGPARQQGCPFLICWFAPSVVTGEVRLMIYGVGDLASPKIMPTHWQPLPAPPEEGG